eukprot:g43094.t1
MGRFQPLLKVKPETDILIQTNVISPLGGPTHEACILQTLFRPTPRLKQLVSAEQERLGLSREKPYVVVQWRAGDYKNQHTNLTVLQQALECAWTLQQLRFPLSSNPIVWISDSEGTKDLLRKRSLSQTGPIFTVPARKQDASYRVAIATQRFVHIDHNKSEKMESAFVDLFLMAESGCILSPMPSGYGNLASNGYGNLASKFMPDPCYFNRGECDWLSNLWGDQDEALYMGPG